MWPISASMAQVCDQFGGQPASRAADQDAGFLLAMATIAAVGDGLLRALFGQDLHLLQCLPQSVRQS
jgi:hypothetical protein